MNNMSSLPLKIIDVKFITLNFFKTDNTTKNCPEIWTVFKKVCFKINAFLL